MSGAVSVAFAVEGVVPSKSNYRKSRGEGSRKAWSAIKRYQRRVGEEALAAGAKRHMGRKNPRVDVTLYNQKLDTDNSLKVICDALQHVAYESDASVWAVSARRLTTLLGDPWAEIRITWEG